VHLSEADADKWPPLLQQVALAKSGTSRRAGPSIADSYESAVSRLRQQQRHLSDDEISLLVATYRAGSTIAELAAQLECDRKTVTRYLKLQCVEMRIRRLTEVQIDEAVRLYESGMSLAKVGRLIGTVPKTVRSRLLERGVQLRTLSTRT
jgi:predicted HTH domain antitoxin